MQRNWADAGVNLRRALEIRPEFARAHINLGLLLARTYHESEALAEFSKAGCDEVSARCNLAFALTLEERYEEARRQYELALVADPSATAAKKGLATLQAHGSANELAQIPLPVRVASPPPVMESRLAAADPTGPPPPGSVTPPVVQASLVSPDIQRF